MFLNTGNLALLNKETHILQSNLADFTKTGDKSNLAKINLKRADHYRRLVKNIVDGALDNAFPIAKSNIAENDWEDLKQFFFENHKSPEPQVWKFPFQLFLFVQDNDLEIKNKYPFIYELLYFEWMEMEVHAQENEKLEEYKLIASNFQNVYLNPYFLFEHFTYPIHKENIENYEENMGDYFIHCWRDYKEHNVSYKELDPVDAVFLDHVINTKNINLSILSTQESIKQFNIEVKNYLNNSVNEFIQDGIIIQL